MANDPIEIGSTSGLSGGGGTPADVTDDTILAAFDYTTSSPLSIVTLDDTYTMDRLRIVIDTIFDGTVSLTCGITGDTDSLQAADENDPTELGSYETWPGVEYAIGTTINLYLSVAGASQGEGRVILDIAS